MARERAKVGAREATERVGVRGEGRSLFVVQRCVLVHNAAQTLYRVKRRGWSKLHRASLCR